MKRRVHLLNAAICPAAGTYDVREIDQKSFFQLLVSAIQDDDIEFKHFIGYEETLDFVQESLGRTIGTGRINRDGVELQDLDEMLVIRLTYHDDNKKEFKNLTLNDFEFLQVFYLADKENVV